jgi:hypothetical protein
LLQAAATRSLHPLLLNLLNGMIAALEGKHDEVIRHTYRVVDSGLGDPEVFYHWAAALAQAGDHDGALGLLERSMAGGFHQASALVRDPRFDAVRATADFRQIVRRADQLQREALEAFRAAGGPQLLGLPQV